MKPLLYGLIVLFIITACDSENSWDCMKASGSIVQEEINLEFFNKLEVRHRVQLIVKQGNEQKVILESGENLLNKINFNVKDSILKIENENTCNLTRDYGITKVYVTSPNIVEIRNGSGLTVLSDGVLTYPKLELVSEDVTFQDEIHTVGDFQLNVDVDVLNMNANGKSNFFIKGKANRAFVGFFSGDSRFEGRDFMVEEFRFFHRSSNKIIVNPQQAIRGKIYSVGDVISINQPPIVEVEQFYTGRLIFE